MIECVVALYRRYLKLVPRVLQFSGVETHSSLYAGERYQAQLRRVCTVLRRKQPNISPETSLRLSLKGKKDTMGPSRLVPTLTGLETFPSLAVVSSDYPIQAERMKALRSVREEITSIFSESRIATAVSSQLQQASPYRIDPGDPVLVHRECSGRWEGPLIVQ